MSSSESQNNPFRFANAVRDPDDPACEHVFWIVATPSENGLFSVRWSRVPSGVGTYKKSGDIFKYLQLSEAQCATLRAVEAVNAREVLKMLEDEFNRCKQIHRTEP